MTAPAIRILGAGAAQGLATQVAREAGVGLAGAFGAVEGILEQFLAGEPCDLLVLAHAQVASLAAGRRVALDFCSDLGSVRTSVAANADDTPSAVSTGAPRPGENELATVYTVALKAGPTNAAARDLASRLTGRESAAARAAAGFEGAAIRRATGADAAAAREVVFGVLAEYGLVPEPDGTDADLMDLDAHYFSRGGTFDVAVDAAGRIVACCGLRPMANGALELRKMYARREARGQGLGRRLLERALAYARGSGCPRVELETASVLKEAIALYEKSGFVPRPGKLDTCRCDRAYVMELA